MESFLSYPIVKLSHEDIGTLEAFYFGVNAVEACAWLAIAAFVFRRWWKLRKSSLEIVYAFDFVLFGATDVLELNALPIWLLLVKAAILVNLLFLRRHVVTHLHTASKF